MRTREAREAVVRVRDLEWPWVASIQPDSTLLDAARLMSELEVGAIAVFERGTLTGVISERDVVRACVMGFELDSTKVSIVMSRQPHTIGIEADVRDAALTMAATSVRHLPVTDGNRVVGMISSRDLLHALSGNVDPRPAHAGAGSTVMEKEG